MELRTEAVDFAAALPSLPAGFLWECIDAEKNTVRIGIYDSGGRCHAHQKIAVDFYAASGVREAGVRLAGRITPFV